MKSSNVGKLLSRLKGVQKSGAHQWKALCPAHDDHTPSLSVKDDDGCILIHCFSGCGVAEIVSSVGLQLHDLFPDTSNVTYPPNHSRKTHAAPPIPASTEQRRCEYVADGERCPFKGTLPVHKHDGGSLWFCNFHWDIWDGDFDETIFGKGSNSPVDVESWAKGSGEEVSGEGDIIDRRDLLTGRYVSMEMAEDFPLSPPFIVEDYLYRDVAVLAAPGGSSKTTLVLWEAIHIALGLPLYGLRTAITRTLYVTAEDSTQLVAATMRELMTGMGLSDEDRVKAYSSIMILDVRGSKFRLCRMDSGGNANIPEEIDLFIEVYRNLDIGLMVFDPLASFGGPEEKFNTSAQGIIESARRIVRGLGCCVRIIHHTGKVAAQANADDQYAPRGGSALSDGARMVAILSHPRDTDQLSLSVGKEENVIVLSRPKLRYSRSRQPRIYLKRNGFRFEYETEIKLSEEERESEMTLQVFRFLESQLAQGRKYSRSALESVSSEINLTVKQVRSAVAKMTVEGLLKEECLPPEERQGSRKTYLLPLRQSK